MIKLHPTVIEHYNAYKKQWDSLPPHLQEQIKITINTESFEQNGKEFVMGVTMGFNTMLEHVLNWVNTASENSPYHPDILTLKDMVSWSLIALFLQTYELTLLESMDNTKGLAN